ncbi:MAG: AAA family ATPase [Elusimicrobiota bacterium]
MSEKTNPYKERLSTLGVYGFGRSEPVILAAMVTEDPLLLIGRSGTGKTYLLNSLSEALGLEHRHYNASMISFDDLVGFPYPDNERSSVKFLETPATVWSAESVLIDEISRCRPEHQNRLFSLVHERRIQGVSLPKLRYRWAAMNPAPGDQAGIEGYSGSEPLDPALADRFSLFVRALDWEEFGKEERLKIVDPGGEGAVSSDGGRLRREIAGWRARFLHEAGRCPPQIAAYAAAAATLLNAARVRVSPRRARLLARSLLAARVVTGAMSEDIFRLVLECSLPQATWGVEVAAEKLAAAHRGAWDGSMLTGDRRWVHEFHCERTLPGKLGLLLDTCPSPDAGTQAIEQLLASAGEARAGAFAFATYPAAAAGRLPVGAEGVNDLGKAAAPILTVDGKVSWQERLSDKDTKHPEFARYAKALSGLRGARRERARQFFNWCLTKDLVLEDPKALEREIHECAGILKARGAL